jgi:Tol biopolymer transport system component
MAMQNNGNQVLNSWKEIASYLQVSVRTAQLWEAQRGLPVRRVPGGRGVVWADPDELDDWRKAASGARPNGGLADPVTQAVSGAPPGTAPTNAQRAGANDPHRAGAGDPQGAGAGDPQRTAPADSPGGQRAALLVLATAACLALVWVGFSRHTPQEDTARSVPLATSPGDEWEASLSPDGTQVAYIWNGDAGGPARNLYVKAVAGGTPRRLTNGAWRDQFPQWSPDGRWIALGRLSGAAVDILLVSPDGAQQRTVARMESPAYRGVTGVQWVSWAPDSKSLVVIERPSLDDPFTAFLLTLDTAERRQITFPRRGTTGDRQCVLSPDGRHLALARYQNDTSSDLYLGSLDGGEPKRLTHDRIYHNGLAWTPDGRELVYGAQRQSQGWGLWRLRLPAVGTASPVRIPGVQEDASWPTVVAAPAGRALRIAYTQSRLTLNIRRWDLPRMLDAAPRTPDAAPYMVCPSSRSDRAVHYSPDGSRIAFVSDREGWREIWVCNADGSEPVKVTSLRGEHTDSPRWAPDSQRLVFTTSFEDNRDVWIADLRTAGLQRLTTEPSHEGRASWSSDGRWIYFRSNRSGRDEIWKTPVEGGGEAVQITRSGAYEPFEALDGSRLYFTKSRAYRGVWSVPITGGEETLVTGDVREGQWSVAADGIYYLIDAEIRVHRFATGKVEPVARIPGAPALWTGFSVRPDGQSFVWCQTTRNDNDIMMLEAPAL